MMLLTSPLEALPCAVAAAMHRDLSDIVEMSLDWQALPHHDVCSSPRKKIIRRPGKLDVRVMMFPQNWETPSLGYPGFAQPTGVLAYTVVVCTKTEACVYFGSDCLAYRIRFDGISTTQAQAWSDDCSAHALVDQERACARYGATIG